MEIYYIYEMRHVPTGRVYVGRHRLQKGKTPETDGYHGSGKLWKQIYKQHSEECVKTLLEVVDDKETADALERLYIARYKDLYGDKCLNIRQGGEGVDEHSEASRKKISEARRGEKHPFFGKRHSEATRKKISEAGKGKTAWNKGKHHSEATRKKMSESHKGEKNPNFGKRGEETSMFGKHHSETTKQKISLANKGKKRSEAAREKMREAQRTIRLSKEQKIEH